MSTLFTNFEAKWWFLDKLTVSASGENAVDIEINNLK